MPIANLNIDSLKFFTGNGNQIIMQKQYSVQWEIIPADCIYSAFLKNPRGHIECDLAENISSVLSSLTYDRINRIYTTDFIKFEDYTLYTGDFPKSTYILFYDKSKNEIPSLEDVALSEGLYKLSKRSSYVTEPVYFKIGFTTQDPATDYVLLSLTRQSSIATVIVDEPGQIQDTVSFYRKSIDTSDGGFDRLVNYKFSKTKDNVSVIGNENLYTALSLSGSNKEHKLTNIYDILFFDYQYRINSKSAVISMANTIRITVNDGTNIATGEYLLRDFFATTSALCKNNANLNRYKCNSLDENSPAPNYIYGVKSSLFTLMSVDDKRTDFDETEKYVAGNQTTAFYILNNNIDESQFPYTKYIGKVYQEKVSAGFIASDTIIIVNDESVHNEVLAGTQRYTYPKIDSYDSEYRFHFRFQPNSEMFFVTSDSAGELNKLTDYWSLTYADKLQSARAKDPSVTNLVNQALFFNVGFITDTEGCYKNTMGIFLRDEETERDFFVGAIEFMSEVEDEDERYRTLFHNFGIPDPIKYPNVFKSQNPEEECTDWKVVNQKSKELFLTYDQIFPYTGTYKALFNAMRFLGYQDIIFKEWYKIKDANDKTRFVAFQNYNTETQKSLQSLLKQYGVNFGDYDRYTKLNRLSMIYHLQQIDETMSEENLPMFNNRGEYVNVPFKDAAYIHTDIPALIDIYEYRADEVLAKLYSVKQWLERYITGVNCYISDITGEYIVIERLKTVGYATEYEFKDFTKSAHFTPRCKQKTEFEDSSAIISCSLNEFKSLTFEDCKDFTISDFIRHEYSVTDKSGNEIPVYDSAPIGALTIGEEYQFSLNLDTSIGSLYEFTDSNYLSNPIMIKNNTITFWNEKLSNSYIDSKELPVIQIKKGNIRSVAGSWSSRTTDNSNVIWSIYMINDIKTGLSYCLMKNVRTGEQIRAKGHINLSPVYENSGSTKSKFFYSSNNNWRMPLFFISGYKVTNEYIGDLHSPQISLHADNIFPGLYKDEDLVLEIIEGSVKFRDRKDSAASNVQNKNCNGAEIIFTEKEDQSGKYEQKIKLNYEYVSDRVPIYTSDIADKVASLNKKSIPEIISAINNSVEINNTVDIPVNRLGDYKVSVKAFDAYNNIYTNVSDKICTISTDEPDIKVIINRDNSQNTEDFYKENVKFNPNENNPAISQVKDFKKIVDKVENTIPIYPISYKIYSDEHYEGDGDSIFYDSISYAMKTPESNDYMILTNMTESGIISNILGNTVTIKMRSSNLLKQNVFKSGGKVNICVFDDNLQVSMFETKTAVRCTSARIYEEYLKPHALTGKWEQKAHIGYLGEISIVVDSDVLDYLKRTRDIINANNNVNLYVINANELEINNIEEIENWIDSETGQRRAFIPIQYHDASHMDSSISSIEENYSKDLMLREFPIDSMVKIRAYNVTDKTMDIISECAYRVINTDIKTYIDEKDSTQSYVVCGYVLDGNIDFSYLKNIDNINSYNKSTDPKDTNDQCEIYKKSDIKFVMKPLHDKAVQYFVRIDDATERSYIYDNESGFYGIMTQVDYNPQQLLFNSYFDDSYAVSVYKFDPMSLQEIWHTTLSKDYVDTAVNEHKMYEFKNFPVTVKQNMEVFVRTDDDCRQLEGSGTNECVKKWIWKVKALEDKSNWKNANIRYDNLTLFESCNDILAVKPYMLGSQKIELYCYDRYGNCIKNTGGGNINVISTEDETENQLERISFIRQM